MNKKIKCYCGHTTTCDCIPENEIEEETLEEAAERTEFKRYGENLTTYTHERPAYNLGFKKGAKWQQERSYSEEEVKEIFYAGFDYAEDKSGNIPNFKQYFEQFKKK